MCTWSIWESDKSDRKRRRMEETTKKRNLQNEKSQQKIVARLSPFPWGTNTYYRPSACDKVLRFGDATRAFPTSIQCVYIAQQQTLPMKCAFKLTFWLLIDFFFAVNSQPASRRLFDVRRWTTIYWFPSLSLLSLSMWHRKKPLHKQSWGVWKLKVCPFALTLGTHINSHTKVVNSEVIHRQKGNVFIEV